ncbi:MAG: DUF2029 domain-containing protein [Hyphomicrobiaceae bacterium]|nr:DUF2029 domain-containing protein [Hyphomicrobiaceae bacterium]
MRLRYFETLLLALTLGYLVLFVPFALGTIAGGHGFQLANGNPVGGDFINLHTAGRLVIEGRSTEIYRPEAFAAAEREIIDEDVGLRLWAYPPQTLLIAPLFGALPYFWSLGLWSVSGLLVLGWGARAVGLGWAPIVALLLSPASLQNLYFGQTGNVATGLLLAALATLLPSAPALPPGLAAGALTFKPQFGLLVPFVWAIGGKWRAFAIALAATIGFAGLAALAFGTGVWIDYATQTMPLLGRLELDGSGAFVFMIPSLFMTLRIAGLPGAAAIMWHGVFAVVVFGAALIGAFVRKDGRQRVAITLLGTALITPYLHVYDMSLPLAGAMVLASGGSGNGRARFVDAAFVVILWVLPHFLYDLNHSGLALSPLILGAALVWAIAKGPDNARPLESTDRAED